QASAVSGPVQHGHEDLRVTRPGQPDPGHPVEYVLQRARGSFGRPAEQAMGEGDDPGQDAVGVAADLPVPQGEQYGGRWYQEHGGSGEPRGGGNSASDGPSEQDRSRGGGRNEGCPGQPPAADRRAEATAAELPVGEDDGELRSGKRDRHGEGIARIGDRKSTRLNSSH